jgi:hypothetical protein
VQRLWDGCSRGKIPRHHCGTLHPQAEAGPVLVTSGSKLTLGPTPDSGDDFVWVCGQDEGFGGLVGLRDESGGSDHGEALHLRAEGLTKRMAIAPGGRAKLTQLIPQILVSIVDRNAFHP